MKKKTLLRIILTIVLFILFLLVLVVYKFQLILNEASVIIDEHCFIVNPAVIERKQKHVEFMDIVMHPERGDDLVAKLKEYEEANNKYIELEEQWLNKMADFGERQDVRFITPDILQESLWLHYKIYEAELNSSKAVQKDFLGQVAPGTGGNIDEIAKAAEEEEEYKRQLGIVDMEIANTFDLRMKFTKPPKSNCPKENFDFPDFYEPETPVNTDVS